MFGLSAENKALWRESAFVLCGRDYTLPDPLVS